MPAKKATKHKKTKKPASELKFDKVDFDLDSIPNNEKWLKNAEWEIIHIRAAALTIQRFDDKGLTEACSGKGQETFLELLENFVSLKEELACRIKIVNTAVERLLICFDRNINPTAPA